MKKNKSKKQLIVNPTTMMVSIDLSQNFHVGYYRCPNGNEFGPFKFDNDFDGFEYFRKSMNSFARKNNLSNIIVGFESTGSYGEPLIHYLRKHDIKMVQVNPSHTKKLKEVHGNSPTKSDNKDTQVIADIMELGHILSVVVPMGLAADLRRLYHERERLVEERTAVFNKLHALISVMFPEFIRVMKDLKTKSARKLLRLIPTGQSTAAYGLGWLSETLKKESRGKLGKKRAELLYQAACQSIGVTEGEQGMRRSLGNMLDQLDVYDQKIKETEQIIKEAVVSHPASKSLLSIKGIKGVTAAGLIGEVGDFKQFRGFEELEKLAGLNICLHESGKKKGERHISKKGRPLLRKLLYFSSLNMIRSGGIFYQEYTAYLAKGKKKLVAMTIIARKLLKLIGSLVRGDRTYVKEYQPGSDLLKKVA